MRARADASHAKTLTRAAASARSQKRRYASDSSDSSSDSLSGVGGRSPGGRGTYGTMAWMQQIVLGLEYEANGVFAETHSSGMVPVRSM